MTKAGINDYQNEKGEWVCGECKETIDIEDGGSCACTRIVTVDGDSREIVSETGARYSWTEGFFEGLRIGLNLNARDRRS